LIFFLDRDLAKAVAIALLLFRTYSADREMTGK
jgi:hypothetical protein